MKNPMVVASCSLLYHKTIGFFTLHSSFFHFHLWCHQKSTISVSQFFPSQTQSIASAHAKHCNRPRKALQLPTQSFASAHAKLCICPRKALRKKRLVKQTKKKSYIAVTLYHFKWCHQESNRGHKDFQSFALPTELWHHHVFLPYTTGAAAPSSVKASAKVVFFICSRKFF